MTCIIGIVDKITNNVFIGCDTYALASIFTNETTDTNSRLLKALETSAHFNTSVCSPFHVITT